MVKESKLKILAFFLKLAMETNLPEDIKERALSVFKSAVSQKFVVKDSIEKVQKEALSEIENVYKGKRFKVHMFKAGLLFLLAETIKARLVEETNRNWFKQAETGNISGGLNQCLGLIDFSLNWFHPAGSTCQEIFINPG